MPVSLSQSDTGFQPVDSDSTAKMAASPSFQPFVKAAQTQKSRRNLPHWQQAGCTYFVTFRLADSLPQSKWKVWQEEREIWLKFHPQPWTRETEDEYEKRFLDRVQEWLDAGYGSCVLSQKAIQDVVARALHYFDRQRY
jgi:hypothetical protein